MMPFTGKKAAPEMYLVGFALHFQASQHQPRPSVAGAGLGGASQADAWGQPHAPGTVSHLTETQI